VDDAWLGALWDRIGIPMGMDGYRKFCEMRIDVDQFRGRVWRNGRLRERHASVRLAEVQVRGTVGDIESLHGVSHHTASLQPQVERDNVRDCPTGAAGLGLDGDRPGLPGDQSRFLRVGLGCDVTIEDVVVRELSVVIQSFSFRSEMMFIE